MCGPHPTSPSTPNDRLQETLFLFIRLIPTATAAAVLSFSLATLAVRAASPSLPPTLATMIHSLLVVDPLYVVLVRLLQTDVDW